MFGELFRGWARKRYRAEAETLIAHLRGLSNEDVGLVLAIALHHRSRLIDSGAGLDDLTGLARAQPMYQHELAKAVNVLTREGRQHDAIALQVWVHSLRAAADASLREHGAALWRELARGRAHVDAGKAAVKRETGFELDVGDLAPPSEFAQT